MKARSRRNELAKTGPQICCYCDSKFRHYFALKCHVVSVHVNSYRHFLRMPLGKLSLKNPCISTTRPEDFARERRRLAERKRKRATRAARLIRMRTSPDRSTRRFLLRSGRPAEGFSPEPIGELIICHICPDKFYERKYLDWHIKTEHELTPHEEAALKPDVSKASAKSNVNNYGSKSSESFDGIPEIPLRRLDGNVGSPKPSTQEKRTDFACKRCSKSFGDVISLKRHLSLHVTFRAFKCPNCSDHYLSQERLHKHIANFHQEASSNQDGVGATLGNSRTGFQRFEYNSPLECFLCKKTFTSGRGLQCHVKTVHGGLRTVRCEPCKEDLPVSEIFTHVNLHIKPFQCKVCRKRFPDENEKDAHEGNHKSYYGEMYPCTKCDKSYFYETSLERHVAAHHRL